MGRGLHLTIDEWFYHWFGEDDNYKATAKLFISIFEICDKIVLQKGTRLAAKFYALCEESNNYPPLERTAAKVLSRLFLQNSNKIHWVEEVEDLSEEIIPLLPRKDLYLVQICLQANEKYLITSDATLYQNLIDTKDVLGITPYMVKDFMNIYPDFY